MRKKVNLIVVPQEFESANHKELWNEISKDSKDLTIILDIGADLFVSIFKRKFYRLFDALKGPKVINENMIVIRPFYILRPEISNSLLNSVNAFLLKHALKKFNKEILDFDFNVLYYIGNNYKFLKKLKLKMNFYYYLLDEVRSDAHDNNFNSKRTKDDVESCEKSDYIFLMSSKLLTNRMEYSYKSKVIGNGATQKETNFETVPMNRSVGIVGNIRNWVDCTLLENLIALNKDVHFGFVGNIETNMLEFMNHITGTYENVKYYGMVNKSEINQWYKKFNVIIVPYKQNEFMQATRPIKIVESIFSSTPVVTIPIDGYKESSFIKFARNEKEFSSLINYFISNKIDVESKEYKDFLKYNSWKYKAEEILKEFK